MAEVALADKNFSGAGFSNRSEIYSVTYDFSVDGGATADWLNLDAFVDTVGVELLYVYVSTAFTSGGAATVSIGKGSGGTEFISAGAVAGFSANAMVLPDTPGTIVRFVADTDSLALSIGTAALTAGVAKIAYRVYTL